MHSTGQAPKFKRLAAVILTIMAFLCFSVQPGALYGCKPAISNWQCKEICFGKSITLILSRSFAKTLQDVECASSTFHKHGIIFIKVHLFCFPSDLYSGSLFTTCTRTFQFAFLSKIIPFFSFFPRNSRPPCSLLALSAVMCWSLPTCCKRHCKF